MFYWSVRENWLIAVLRPVHFDLTFLHSQGSECPKGYAHWIPSHPLESCLYIGWPLGGLLQLLMFTTSLPQSSSPACPPELHYLWLLWFITVLSADHWSLTEAVTGLLTCTLSPGVSMIVWTEYAHTSLHSDLTTTCLCLPAFPHSWLPRVRRLNP